MVIKQKGKFFLFNEKADAGWAREIAMLREAYEG